MTRTILTVLLTILLAATAQAGEFKVTRVTDGGTIKAIGHDIEITVRLMAIDAPELGKKGQAGQPYSQQAKKFLAGLVLNKVVDVQGWGTDRYNRVLAGVVVDGKNVNLELVRAGMA